MVNKALSSDGRGGYNGFQVIYVYNQRTIQNTISAEKVLKT